MNPVGPRPEAMSTAPGAEASVLLFVGAFAFDFRGQEGGSLIQYVYAAVAVLFGILAIALGNWNRTRALMGLLYGTILAISIGTISAIVFFAPVERWIRVVLPFVLFTMGIWIGAGSARETGSLLRVLRVMFALAIVSQVFRLWFANVVAGIGITEARYQILSPVVLFPIAYGVARLFYGRSFPIISLLGMFFCIGAVLLSITRSFLISLVALLAFSTWMYWKTAVISKGASQGILFKRPIISALVVVGFIASMAQIAVVLRPEMIASWSSRLFEARVQTTGIDYTYLTRVAELKGIVGILADEPASFLIGRGFGSTYQFDMSYADDLRDIAPHIMELFVPTWYASHNVFTYALFFGGIYALWWQIWIYLRFLQYAKGCYMRIIEESDYRVRSAIFATALFCILTISQSITSNPFGERLSAAYFGLCAGMMAQLVSPKVSGYLNQRMPQRRR